jgi:hypothetical protein
MPIDPSIPLQVRPFQLESPLAQAGQVMSLQNMLQQGDLRKLQIEELKAKSPLQLEELRLKIQRSKNVNDLVKGLFGGSAPTLVPGQSAIPAAPAEQDAIANAARQLEMIGRLAAADPQRGRAMLEYWKASNPEIKWINGVPTHGRTGQPITSASPIPTMTAEGLSAVPVMNKVTGQYEIQVPKGGPEAFKTYRDIREGTAAGYETTKIMAKGPDGVVREYTVPKSLLPQIYSSGQPAPVAPAASVVAPMSPTGLMPQLANSQDYMNASPQEQQALRTLAGGMQGGIGGNVQSTSPNVLQPPGVTAPPVAPTAPIPSSAILTPAGAPTPAETEANKEAAQQGVKELVTNYGTLRNSEATINNLAAAKKLMPNAKAFMGPGGEPIMRAVSFLNNRIGTEINIQGITDATELRSRVFFQIMDNLKKLDAQPSQQQQFIMQEALGNLGTDPNAMPKILEAFEGALRDRVATHNKDVDEAEKRGVKFPTNVRVRLPPMQKRGAPQAAIDYLKANPGTRDAFKAKYGYLPEGM